MNKDILAAGRYAQSLLEISREMGRDEAVEAELESLSAALRQSPPLEQFMANPAVKTADKRQVLKRLYGGRTEKVYGVLLNFFSLLLEKKRFYLVHDIAVVFKRIADEAQGQAVAEIRSAVPLKAEAEKRIVHRLEKLTGHEITVRTTVDPSLVGGVLIKVRNQVIDDSVTSKIQAFKKELTKIQSI